MCWWTGPSAIMYNFQLPAGGLDKQIQELVEAVVLPVTHKERFKSLGIRPPKGVLLYGPPGTGGLARQGTASWSRQPAGSAEGCPAAVLRMRGTGRPPSKWPASSEGMQMGVLKTPSPTCRIGQ